MIDTHYDLLSICYVCYLNNDYTKIENIANEIRNNKGNLKGIFANLYFMTKEEMKEELGEKYYQENVSVLEMFKIAKSVLEKYLPDVEFIYSIEGCDYIKVDELDELYQVGLRSIILVWNNQNIYGSGNRSNIGLTEKGAEFLKRAIDLGIGIDLSHANQKTFYDMISLIKYNKLEAKEVICYASHSNSRRLCDRKRNLTNEQLLALKQVGGLVGIFSNTNFIVSNINVDNETKRKAYMDHILYITDMIGVDNVMLSTDDMRYCGIEGMYGLPIYDYNTIYRDIRMDLLSKFSISDIDKIMYKNAEKIMNKLNYNEKKKVI